MLILSRKRDEKIIMTAKDGTEIAVTVTQIRRDRVRLGIEAPEHIKVHRDEHFDGESSIGARP